MSTSTVASTSTATPTPTRPLYWSVRRELWENRSIYLGPLAVAAFVLLGFLVSTASLPRRMAAVMALEAAKQHKAVVLPYSVIAGLMFVTAFIVGAFYCLDALFGERRDRSLLFWKSLPVSDRTAVLAKASIPLAVLPVIAFTLIAASQLVMLLLSTVVLLGTNGGVATLWGRLPLVQMWLAMAYAGIAIALWHAPIYAWLLLVSAWAHRAPLLWAVLPPLAAGVFEAVAFRTSFLGQAVKHRLIGWFTQGFVLHGEGTVPDAPLTHLSPGRLLSAPGLWAGLIFAALCLAAAARLRRDREPL